MSRPVLIALLCLLSFKLAAEEGPNLLPSDLMDGSPTYNPWSGVDDLGRLHGIGGKQKVVNDDGSVSDTALGPGIAVGVLSGSGLQDLVLADGHGFFWYYKNSGTKTAPKFTIGEVLPIWVGEFRSAYPTEGVTNTACRIQLKNMTGSGKLDLVVGTYSGKLYYFPNIGTGSDPRFAPSYNLKSNLIDTRSRGVLWCNYLAPFFVDWTHNNILDLVIGEGTYSANSIYLLSNQGSTAQPLLNENKTSKMIPGMGREHLTPIVFDYNGDGKLDVVAGERSGYINVFLNTSKDADQMPPTFDNGQHLRIGSRDTFGNLVTVATQDFTGNGLPNLLIGNDSGILYGATNTGTNTAPKFATLEPVKGKNPDPQILVPTHWSKLQAFGNAYELLTVTSAATEPGFTMPPDSKNKNALKFSMYPVTSKWIPDRFINPAQEDLNEHLLKALQIFRLQPGKHYKLTFKTKARGEIRNFKVGISGHFISTAGYEENYDIKQDLNTSPEWSSGVYTFTYVPPVDKKLWNGFDSDIDFRFSGQPTLYIADVELHEEL